MTVEGSLLIILFVAATAFIARPVGLYLAAVFAGADTALSRVLTPIERTLYRAAGVWADIEQDWRAYSAALLVFSALSTLVLFAILRFQSALPFNPQGFGGAPPGVAMNTPSAS